MTKLAVVALLLGIFARASVACGQAAPTGPSETILIRSSPPIPEPAPTQEPGAEDEQDRIVGTPITVNMTGVGTAADPGVFDPVDFTFSVGEAVNFTLFAEDAFHSFTVSELEINVEVNAGESDGLDFVFEEAGTYELICVPHEALGMVGTITVQ